jgi:DNA invertase Pin-like site-specific DNA recombinase
MAVNCVGYMRCSGASQVEGDTWDRQIEKIRALAEAQGLTLEKEWREEGVSGKIECEHRPVFQTMLAELLSNGCRTIIVEDLSRLARRYAVQEQILFYLCAKGITLWTCANGGENITEAMNQDPTKRLVIGMMGLISQWEREQIVEKLRAARQRKKAKGLHAEGRHAFGQKPGEDEILTSIKALKSTGESLRKIATILNQQGIKSRMGGPWNASVIGKILGREIRF